MYQPTIEVLNRFRSKTELDKIHGVKKKLFLKFFLFKNISK
jgi:hypothetical protein